MSGPNHRRVCRVAKHVIFKASSGRKGGFNVADFALIRIDHRLIHGQVVGIWMKELKADHILVIDDPLAKDSFMQRIYTAAAPPTAKVEMMAVDQVIERWNEDQFGSGSYLVLLRDVDTVLRVWKGGFPIKQLQIGNLAAIPGKKLLHKSSRLTQEHLDALSEMVEGGVEVFCQAVPLENKVDLRKLG